MEGCSPSIRPISKLLCTLPLSSRHPGNASHTRVIHEHQIAGSLLAHHQADACRFVCGPAEIIVRPTISLTSTKWSEFAADHVAAMRRMVDSSLRCEICRWTIMCYTDACRRNRSSDECPIYPSVYTGRFLLTKTVASGLWMI